MNNEMDALLEKDRLDDKRREDKEYEEEMSEDENDAWDCNEGDYL